MTIKPITTEKAVKLIEAENTIMFMVDRRMKKPEVKKKVEEMFNVKVEKIRSHIKDNKKIAYVKLKGSEAIDLATSLGMM